MPAKKQSVREAILSELAGKEIRPLQLLEILERKGFVESDIREQLPKLLRAGLIELTSQRVLKGSKTQNAA
jgi:predicted transcriptional regulator